MKKRVSKAGMKTSRFGLISLVAIFLLSGAACTGGSSSVSQMNHQQQVPERFSLPEPERFVEPAREGSIYNGRAMNIYSDNRAREVGDIILVRVVETSSGRNNANTKAERSGSVSAGLPNFFGLESFVNARSPDFKLQADMVSGGLRNNFEGKGNTDRNSNIQATISARIIDKTMDGNLVIRGYQEMRVNNETQFIILSGLVRPDDITADNAVLSNRIADARIEYGGKGVLSDKQRPGWLSRTVDAVWPF